MHSLALRAYFCVFETGQFCEGVVGNRYTRLRFLVLRYLRKMPPAIPVDWQKPLKQVHSLALRACICRMCSLTNTSPKRQRVNTLEAFFQGKSHIDFSFTLQLAQHQNWRFVLFFLVLLWELACHS